MTLERPGYIVVLFGDYLWLESTLIILLLYILLMLLSELLLRRRITHILTEQVLPVVLSDSFGDFVNLWLESVLPVDFLLFHLFDYLNFLLVLFVQSLEAVLMIFDASLWIRLTNNLGGQVNLRLKRTLCTLAKLVCGFLPIFLLFLEEGILALMEVFQVAVEHV